MATPGASGRDLEVRVDPDRCTGHGRCYELAPEVFDEDEVGHCVVRAARVPGSLERAARNGAANCPEHAIEVRQAGPRPARSEP